MVIWLLWVFFLFFLLFTNPILLHGFVLFCFIFYCCCLNWLIFSCEFSFHTFTPKHERQRLNVRNFCQPPSGKSFNVYAVLYIYKFSSKEIPLLYRIHVNVLCNYMYKCWKSMKGKLPCKQGCKKHNRRYVLKNRNVPQHWMQVGHYGYRA